MRGEAPVISGAGPVARITPAHAGRSTYFGHPELPGWDHPRACGEKALPPRIKLGHGGSPPRMRGEEARERV